MKILSHLHRLKNVCIKLEIFVDTLIWEKLSITLKERIKIVNYHLPIFTGLDFEQKRFKLKAARNLDKNLGCC